MTKKGKRILGVIMGAAVMMAAAGCGQSADSGTKDAQEVKVSENNAENVDSAQAESAEEATGTIEMWSMLTQQERADELQKLADSYMEQNCISYYGRKRTGYYGDRNGVSPVLGWYGRPAGAI